MNKTDLYSICDQFDRINSQGFLLGDNPLGCSLPTFILQFSIISLLTRLLHFLLKSIGQPLVVAQILGGVLLGPSGIGQNYGFMLIIFPKKSRLLLDTVSGFGVMLFVFLIGVKMDPSIVVRSGRQAIVVGISSFLVPLALAGTAAFLLDKYLSLDDDVERALFHIVQILSMSAFPVITCFLEELKILNSDVGRLASSSSMVCDVCFWAFTCINASRSLAGEPLYMIIGPSVSVALFLVLVVFFIRPMALWVIQQTPETETVKETYIVLALVTLTASVFIGDSIGIMAVKASLILGLVVPDGPPLGAALVNTLDCFVMSVLMPLFFADSGLKVDVFRLQNLKNIGVLQLVVFVAFVAKTMGSMLPLIFYKMPFRDALSLGLIMNTKGVVELFLLNDLKNAYGFTDEVYTFMIISVVAISAVLSAIVKILYDPSKRFIAYKRRTVLHLRDDDELRVLACVHQQENVNSIINLLQVSSSTKDSPIKLIVLHLIELLGRSSSLLISHTQSNNNPRKPSKSERIFNAFKKFEEQNAGYCFVHSYKGIAPYKTMHNDICSLALENRTILIILPFQNLANGMVGSSSNACRHLAKNVFEKAPCSAGVLIDHRTLKSRHMITEHSVLRVAALFFGGADDREALAYARRMSDHLHVTLTVIRFVTPGPSQIVAGTERSKMLDAEILSNLKHINKHSVEVTYKEKTVETGMDVVMVARSVVNAYNLVMVGRRHGDSAIIHQVERWNKRVELGAIGEVFATLGVKGEALILVVQQQTRLWGLKDPEDSTHLRRVNL